MSNTLLKIGKTSKNTNQHSEKNTIIEDAKRVIRIEAAAIAALESRIDATFEVVVNLLYECRGRVIVTGVGKSGHIGKKIAATLSSTGTPSLFLHAAEGLHGDLGGVRREDRVICISKNGNNPEFDVMIPFFHHMGIKVIAMTGNIKSELAKKADYILDISVQEEACPLDLAPTASSTATLVMGDALAVALLAKRNFSAEDFAFRHPGGTLGRRLLLRIDDLMGAEEKLPTVNENADLDTIIKEISQKRYGATCVLNEQNELLGIITDGDLRRMLRNKSDHANLSAKDILTKNPKTVSAGMLAVKALELMEDFNIMQIIVMNDDGNPVGIVHLHDLLKAGVA